MTNPHRAFTNPSTGDRVYVGVNPEDQYVSVTSVLSALPKQQYLMPWAAKVVAETAQIVMESLAYGGGVGEDEDPYMEPYYDLDSGELDIELLCLDLKNAWKWDRDGAGEQGDAVHDICEELMEWSQGDYEKASALFEMMRDKHTTEVCNRVEGFLDFLRDNDVVPVSTEFTTYNDSHGYAGSCDLAAYVNGVPCFIDYKTSRNISNEIALQITAYSRGEYILTDDSGANMVMPFADEDEKDIRGYILHLQSTKARLIEVDISDEMFDAFLSLLLVKRLWLGTGEKEAVGEVVYDSSKHEEEE